MKWILFGVIIALVAVAISMHLRFIKTIYLIATVQPYEQSGEAGRVLIVGDSTGYGTGASASAHTVAGLLGTDFPAFAIENRSVNGDTLADALERVQDIDSQYDLVLLQLGGNDVIQQRPLEDIENSLEAWYQQLAPYANEIVMMSFGDVGASIAYSGDETTEYTKRSQAFHSLAQSFADQHDSFAYVDLSTLNVLGPFSDKPHIYLSLDGLHPSDAGYALWYQQLAPIVRERLAVGREGADTHSGTD